MKVIGLGVSWESVALPAAFGDINIANTGSIKRPDTIMTESHMTDYEHTGSESDLKAIDRIRDAHVAALNRGDGGAWAAQFTDDGVQMPPNAAANLGRTMIESWSKGFMDLFRLEFHLAVDEVRVMGEWAFERGTYTITLNPKSGGPPVPDIGKYITIYERESGDGWRIARDIWNSSNPPPGR